MTRKEDVAKELLRAVNDVLGVGEDQCGMNDIDWNLLRRARRKALRAGIKEG